MHLDLSWRAHSGTEDRRGLRSAAGFLVAALGVGAVLLVMEFNQDARVFSDPALDELLRAQSYLDRSYGPEKDLLSESYTVHRDLDQAVGVLAAAAQAAPAEGQKIAELRSGLQTLERAEGKNQLTPEELDARYRNLRGQLAGLINTRREPGR
jgi:hypothetical protein